MILEIEQNKFHIRCDTCGKEQWYTKRKARNGKRKYCSHKCINAGRSHSEEWKKEMSKKFSGELNPYYGKKHNEEILQKMKQNSKEGYAKFKNSLSDDEWKKFCQNYGRSGEFNGFFGKKHTEEAKKKMSETRARKIANGEIILKHPHGLRGEYKTKHQTIEIYDSFYEYVYMKYLDSNIKIIGWTKKHGIVIPYELNNEQRIYIPDLLITKEDHTKTLVEIKGYEEKNKKFAKFDVLEYFTGYENFMFSILQKHEIENICKKYFGFSCTTLRKKYKNGQF